VDSTRCWSGAPVLATNETGVPVFYDIKRNQDKKFLPTGQDKLAAL
jgi:hypothetical protein